MSSASSLLYYLGLNSIDDEVSRLNNSSSVPSSSFAPPSNATQNSHAVTPAGSQPGAPSVVAGISNNASSPESSTRIEQHSARVAITRILNEPQNQQLAPVAQSTSNNNINKTTNERTCNFCGNYGANARCSACQSAFYCSKECQAKDWQDGKHWEHCFLSIDNEADASDPTLGAKNNTIPSNTDAPTTASATSTHTTSNRNANLVDLNDPFLFAKAPVGIQPESPTMSSNSIAAKIHNNHSMHIPGLITSKKAISNENMKNQDPYAAAATTNIAGGDSLPMEETVIPISHFYPGNAFRDLDDDDDSDDDDEYNGTGRNRGGDTNFGKHGLGYIDDNSNHYDDEGVEESGGPMGGSSINGKTAKSLVSITANSGTRRHSQTGFDYKRVVEPTMKSQSTSATARDTILNRAIQEAVDEALQQAQLHHEQQKHLALSYLKKELEQVHYIDKSKAIKEVEHKVRMEVLELYRFGKEPPKVPLSLSQNEGGLGLGASGDVKDGKQMQQQQGQKQITKQQLLQQKLVPQSPQLAKKNVRTPESLIMMVPQQTQKQQQPSQPKMQKSSAPEQKPLKVLQLQPTEPRHNKSSSSIEPLNHASEQVKGRVSFSTLLNQPQKTTNTSVPTAENNSTTTTQTANNSFTDANKAESMQSSKIKHGYLHQNQVQTAIAAAVEQANKKLRSELTKKYTIALKEEKAKYERQLAEVIEIQAEEELDDAIGLLVGGVKGGVFAGITTPVKGTPVKNAQSMMNLRVGGGAIEDIETNDLVASSKVAGGGATRDGMEGERILANSQLKKMTDAGGAVSENTASEGIATPSKNDATANRQQIEEEFRKIWDQEKELAIQKASEAKELALKDLEARLVMEHTTAVEKLQQELFAYDDKLEMMKASYEEEKDKCKTEALISLNEKLYEFKKSHTKELEELELKISKEKNAVIDTIKKRLHNAEENTNKLKKELQESKSNAANAMSEAVEKAIEQTTVDHQTEIDRIKKKHDTKLQNFQALTKVDTERAIATAVEKAIDTEKQNGGSTAAVEKIRSEANKQIAGLKNELAELEKDREKLKLRLDIAEQWLKERDGLRIEVDQLKKDALMIDISGLKSKLSEQEEISLQLREERDNLQNEVIDLKKQLGEIENEVATIKQAQEFNLKMSSAEKHRANTLSHNTLLPKLPNLLKDEIDNDPLVNGLLNTPLPRKIHSSAEVATAPRSLNSSSSFCSEGSFNEVPKSEGKLSSKRGSLDPCSGIRLMILNVEITEAIEDMVDELGIWLVNDTIIGAANATHIIAGDNQTSLRRTPKFMVCISRTSNILHMDWLLNSYAEKRILDCRNYILLNDSVAEKMYKFSMSQTLDEGNKRRQEGGLLKGYRIFICEGVAGNKAPKEEEFQMMIKAANGSTCKYSDINLLGGQELAKTIVITSNPATSSQKADKKLSRLAKNGGHLKPATWLFDCIINQKIKGI